MKYRIEQWVTVDRDPLVPEKVWVTFQPDYDAVEAVMEEQGFNQRRAVNWLWAQGGKEPKDHFATWDSEDPHRFAFEWLDVAEADAYLAAF